MTKHHFSGIFCYLLIISHLLIGCTEPPKEDDQIFWRKSNTTLQIPTAKQLDLSLTRLPPALFQFDVAPTNDISEDSITNNQSATSSISTRQKNHNTTNAPLTISENISSNWDFDPFNGNAEFNRTESACGIPPDYEPNAGSVGSSLHRFGTSSFCLITVAKLATLRAVGNYSNFSQILPDIARGLSNANNPKGVLQTFNNDGVASVGADGLKIEIFYDDCANQRDPIINDTKALNYCIGEPDSAIYHRVMIFPLTPKNGTSITTSIGEMEWFIQADGSSNGRMTISKDLMSETDFIAFAPPQIQFEFESDLNGDFQSFTLKFAPQLPPGSTVSRDSIWNANVIKVTKIPSDGTNPSVWSVQGNIQYTLTLGTNPLYTGPFTFEPFGHLSTPRVYFSAVAEDIFVDGSAVYKAIMADAPGVDLTEFPPASWSKEFHLWAAYKKMLKVNYSQLHYELAHNFADPQLIYGFDKESTELASIIKMGTHTSHIRRVAINSVATLAVSASSDGSIGVWDIDPGSNTFQQKIDEFIAPHGGNTVNHVQFSPIDDNLILSTGHDGFAKVFNLSNKQEIISFEQLVSNTVFTVQADWSADGLRIATASNQGTKIWDAISGVKIADLGDFGVGVRNVDFDPTNSNFILTSGALTAASIWDISAPVTAVSIFTDPDAGQVTDATFSPDGLSVASVNNTGVLYLWDRTNDITPIKNEVLLSGGARRGGNFVEWSSDASYIFVQAWGSIIRFDSTTLTYDETYVGYANPFNTNGLTSFTVLPDNNIALVGHNGAGNQPVYIEGYDLTAGDKTLAFYLPGRITTFDANYSPSGAEIVSASSGGQVDIWKAYNSQPIRELSGHLEEAYTARYNNDGSKIVSTSADGTAKVWDALTGTQLLSLSHPGSPPLTSAAFSTDGTKIISTSGRRGSSVGVSSGDGTVIGWDAVTGAQATVQTSIRNSLYQWVLSPNGSNEYYLLNSTGGDPFLSEPSELFVNSLSAISGIAGTLAVDEWDYADNDSLGFSTLYLQSATAPDTLPIDTININHLMVYATGATVVNEIAFSPIDNQHFVLSTNIGAQWWVVNNTDTPLCTFNINEYTQFAEVSPDGLRVITAANSAAKLWNVDTASASPLCRQLGVVGHPFIEHAKFSPNDTGLSIITQGSGSGSSSSAFFALWDMDPTSVTFQSQLKVFREPAAQVQLARRINNISFSNNAKQIITMGTAKAVNPAWLDFDGWFAELDVNGKFIRPDEDDNANPYYVDLVTTNSGCYATDINGNCGGTTGFQTCADVGGCQSYSVISQFTHDQNATTPDPKFNYLKTQLDALSPEWLTDEFVAKPIN